jgi:predicted RNA-binding protein with TRAM domain
MRTKVISLVGLKRLGLLSVGEEYIVTIEEMGKDGSGVARLGGVSIVVNNTNPGDKVKVRITKLGRFHAAAEVFG